jgi:hypothetical protein
MQGLVNESIQSVTIPGLSLNVLNVLGMDNTGRNPREVTDNKGRKDFPHPENNFLYPGTNPVSDVLESMVCTIGFRNYLINWCYMWAFAWSYYRRNRTVGLFNITVTMKDSAVDIIRFKLSNCFISGMPNLVFSYTRQFNESDSFDCNITFNKFDVEFVAPDFNLKMVDFTKEDIEFPENFIYNKK